MKIKIAGIFVASLSIIAVLAACGGQAAPQPSPEPPAKLSPKAEELWDKLLSTVEKDAKNPAAQTPPKAEPVPAPPLPQQVPPQPVPVPAPGPNPPLSSPPPVSPPVAPPIADPALTPARDLTGTWAGTGVYYYADTATGSKVKTVRVQVTMKINQNESTANANMSMHVVKQEPTVEVSVKDSAGSEKYALMSDGDENVTLKGTVSSTNLSLTSTSTVGYLYNWQLTFTTDLMSGGFRFQQAQAAPYEIKCDPKAFELVRQK